MTASSGFRAIPTAHQAFKDHYGRSIRASLAVVLTTHALAFVLVPGVTIRPFRLVTEETTVVFDVPDVPPDVRVTPEPAMPPRPGVAPAEAPEPAAPADPPPPPAPGNVPVAPRATIVTDGFRYYTKEPALTVLVTPAYPRLAREARIEGRVLVRVLVDENGRVADAVVVEADATPAMVEAALGAARACRFEPARQGHVPVPAHVTIPFSFSLR